MPATKAKVKISFFMDLVVFAIIVIKQFVVNVYMSKIMPKERLGGSLIAIERYQYQNQAIYLATN